MSEQEISLNKKTRSVLAHARRETGRLLHISVEPGHLLLGIVRQGDCFAAELIRRNHPDIEGLQAEVEAMLGPGSLETISLELPLSHGAEEILRLADAIRRQLRHEEVRSDHLLLAMTHDTDASLATLLSSHGLSSKRILEAILAEYGVVQHATPIEILLLQGLAKSGDLSSRLIESLLNRKEGESVRDALVESGLLDEKKIVDIVAREFGCQSLDLEEFTPDPQLIKQFPGDLAQRLNVFPVRYDSDEDALYIALADPFESAKLEEIQSLWGVNVVPMLTGKDALRQLLDGYFPKP